MNTKIEKGVGGGLRTGSDEDEDRVDLANKANFQEKVRREKSGKSKRSKSIRISRKNLFEQAHSNGASDNRTDGRTDRRTEGLPDNLMSYG